MPVFRKGRLGWRRKEALDREIVRSAGKRAYRERQTYEFTDTPFGVIKQRFSQTFCRGSGHDFIENRFRETGRPQVVLEWGCGEGKATGTLAKEYEGLAKVYGYSKDSYPGWTKTPGVKFIHETKERLLRYLKDGTVDLIYSYSGLEHLTLAAGRPLASYIKQLVPKLSNGGRLIFTDQHMDPDMLSELKRQLGDMAAVEIVQTKPDTTLFNTYCITRN
jgi:SAM-dependent methyltransferase